MWILTWSEPWYLEEGFVGWSHRLSDHLPGLRQSHFSKKLWQILVIFHVTRNLNDTEWAEQSNNLSIKAWHKSYKLLQLKANNKRYLVRRLTFEHKFTILPNVIMLLQIKIHFIADINQIQNFSDDNINSRAIQNHLQFLKWISVNISAVKQKK